MSAAVKWIGESHRRTMVLCQLEPVTTATSRWFCRLQEAEKGAWIGYGLSEDEAATSALEQMKGKC